MAKKVVSKNETRKYPRQFEIGSIRVKEYGEGDNTRESVKVILNKGIELAINGEVVPLQETEDGGHYPITLFALGVESVERGEAELVKRKYKKPEDIEKIQAYRDKVGVTHVLKINVPDDFLKNS